MKIAIATTGRPERQKALAQIPAKYHDRLLVFTKACEAGELKKNVPATTAVVCLPDETDGVADTRQKVIDYLPLGKVWMIDDLCSFKKRHRRGTGYTYSPLAQGDFDLLYERIESLLDNHLQVGVSPHNGNNRFTEDTAFNCRAYSTYGLRTDWMKQYAIRFDEMYSKDNECKFMEDFYVTLRALTSGFTNALVCDFCFQYQHNSRGGNSTNRTLGRHNKSAAMLAAMFPGFVKLVRKKGEWGSRGSEMQGRTEVRVQWKKARQFAQRMQSSHTSRER